MNILLTGGAGYIGSHTVVALTHLNHSVVLLDNLVNSHAQVLEKLEKITAKRLPFIEGDVRDTASLIKILQDYKIDAVIHLAGLKAVGESVEKPVDYYANNVQGTVSLLQAMQAVNIKKLIFSSSATVYGQPQYLPIDENHPLSTTNPYGRSKLHIEEMLRDVALSDNEWHIVCLRYFNPVGAHESGLIGEDPQGIPNNLMPFIAQVAAGKLPELKIWGNDYPTPDGTGVRDYIHVMDLAEGHAAALPFLQKTTGWHAVNLGTGQGYSVFDMLKAYERACGHTIPYSVAPRRAGDIAACYADPAKAAELFAWKTKRTLDDMCVSSWRFVV